LGLLKELLMQLQTIDSEAGFMADSTNTNAVPKNTSLRVSLANSLSIKLSDPDQIPESDTPTGVFAKKYLHELKLLHRKSHYSISASTIPDCYDG
jgi:hypothetical protein